MLNERATDTYTRPGDAAAPALDGVVSVNVKRVPDETGSLSELARLTAGVVDDLAGFRATRIDLREVDPGAVQAFEVRLRSSVARYVPWSSKLLLVLGDVRKGSVSEGLTRRLVLGDGTSRLILIPPGVAYGVRNLGAGPGQLIDLVDASAQPDEGQADGGRLPWDHFGADVFERVFG